MFTDIINDSRAWEMILPLLREEDSRAVHSVFPQRSIIVSVCAEALVSYSIAGAAGHFSICHGVSAAGPLETLVFPSYPDSETLFPMY